MKARAAYHSPLREAQAAATRQRIMDSCVATMRRGDDLTFAAVATDAGVQERTVYRYFPRKEDLQAAVWNWILEHLTHVELAPEHEEQLIAAMRQSFAGFDAGAPLIQALLHSSQGLELRRSQQPARRGMLQACVDNAAPGAPAAVRDRAAAVLQVLYSASSWELLRNFWGMDATEAADAVELGIRSFLAGLRLHVSREPNKRDAGPSRTRRKP